MTGRHNLVPDRGLQRGENEGKQRERERGERRGTVREEEVKRVEKGVEEKERRVLICGWAEM